GMMSVSVVGPGGGNGPGCGVGGCGTGWMTNAENLCPDVAALMLTRPVNPLGTMNHCPGPRGTMVAVSCVAAEPTRSTNSASGARTGLAISPPRIGPHMMLTAVPPTGTVASVAYRETGVVMLRRLRDDDGRGVALEERLRVAHHEVPRRRRHHPVDGHRYDEGRDEAGRQDVGDRGEERLLDHQQAHRSPAADVVDVVRDRLGGRLRYGRRGDDVRRDGLPRDADVHRLRGRVHVGHDVGVGIVIERGGDVVEVRRDDAAADVGREPGGADVDGEVLLV